MKKRYAFLLATTASLLAALSCTIPPWKEAIPPTIGPPPAYALPSSTEASETEALAQSVTSTKAPPSPTTTITAFPMATRTFVHETVTVRATRNTNCRTGPGLAFDLVYILLAGTEAEIIARSPDPEYVIIEIPDRPRQECWLWMEYTRMTGSIWALPERTPPWTATIPPTNTPTPTPTETPSPTATATATSTWTPLPTATP